MSLDVSARRVVFTGGRLRFIEDGEITVVAPFPDVVAHVRRIGAAGESWSPCRPAFDLDRMGREATRARKGRVEPESPRHRGDVDAINAALDAATPPSDPATCRGLAFAAFLDPVPRAVLATLRRFPSLHYDLLAMSGACRTDAVVDLARSNPALAWMIARPEAWKRGTVDDPPGAARALLEKRRREVAGWLGFPESEGTVKILAKIPPRALGFDRIAGLRDALADPECRKTCAHLPTLEAPVIGVVAEPELRAAVRHSFLEEIAGSRKDRRIAGSVKLLKDTLAMVRELDDGRPPPPIRSLDELQWLHDDLIERVAELRAGEEILKLVFPAPPLAPPRRGWQPSPRTKLVVEPLTTGEMLWREGQEMRHCIATRRSWISLRKSYCYRVLEPDRATVEIARAGAGYWALLEIRGPWNRPVPSRTIAAVNAWIEASQAPPQRPLPFGPGASDPRPEAA